MEYLQQVYLTAPGLNEGGLQQYVSGVHAESDPVGIYNTISSNSHKTP